MKSLQSLKAIPPFDLLVVDRKAFSILTLDKHPMAIFTALMEPGTIKKAAL